MIQWFLYDAIVVGAGQNGLTCACYLARAGLSVLVLEQYRTIGGMTISEELTLPGFQSDVHATGYQLANISPVPASLDLAAHGVELIEPERVYAHAFPDGRAIVVERDSDCTVAALESCSGRDAAACRHLFELFGREQANFVKGMFSAPPSFAATAQALASAPGGMARERFSLQSVRSWANETFETEVVRSLFTAFGLFVGAAPDDAGGAEIAWLFGSYCSRPAIIWCAAACIRSRVRWRECSLSMAATFAPTRPSTEFWSMKVARAGCGSPLAKPSERDKS